MLSVLEIFCCLRPSLAVHVDPTLWMATVQGSSELQNPHPKEMAPRQAANSGGCCLELRRPVTVWINCPWPWWQEHENLVELDVGHIWRVNFWNNSNSMLACHGLPPPSHTSKPVEVQLQWRNCIQPFNMQLILRLLRRRSCKTCRALRILRDKKLGWRAWELIEEERYLLDIIMVVVCYDLLSIMIIILRDRVRDRERELQW